MIPKMLNVAVVLVVFSMLVAFMVPSMMGQNYYDVYGIFGGHVFYGDMAKCTYAM